MFNETAFTMPVQPAGFAGGTGGGMFGGDGWWALIIILALFGGFGRGGFGFGGGGGVGVESEVQRGFDTSNIVGKLDRLGDGLCSLGYDQLAQMNTINQNVSQQGFNLSSAIAQLGYQNQQCCCDIEREIANSTTNIIQSQNAGFQRILDKMCETEIQNLRDKVAEQNNAIQSANFQLSQLSQNATLINTLRPYPVQAVPFCGFNAGFGAVATSGGCGCC